MEDNHNEQPYHCSKGVKNEERLNAVEKTLTTACSDIREIKDNLLSRPTWAITWFLTILSSLMFTSVTLNITLLRVILSK